MKTVLPLKLLLIEEDGCHLLLKVNINGKAATLLLDTGASKTVLDKSRIHRFVADKEFHEMDKLSTGLGVSDMKTHGVVLKKIKIGSLLLKDFESILLDLSHVNVSYQAMRFPAIDGVLGSDILRRYGAVVDFKAGKLKLQWKKGQ